MTFLPHKPVLVLVLLKNSSSWLLRRWSLVCCPDHKSEESIARVASRDLNICKASDTMFRPALVLSAVCLWVLTSWRSPPETANLMTNKIKASQSDWRPVSSFISILLTHSVTNTQTHSHRSPQQTVWPPHTSRLSEPPGRPCYRSGWSPGNSRTVTRRAISQVE